MYHRKKFLAMVLAGVLCIGTDGGFAFGATEHFTDSTTNPAWAGWVDRWEEKVVHNYEKIALTPGADETKMNFAWYTKADGQPTPMIDLAAKDDFSDARRFTGVAESAVDGYVTNKVTVEGLKEHTTYYYRYYKNGIMQKMSSFNTRSFSSFQMLYVGDPQIGASKGQITSSGDKLENQTELHTAARNDAFSWNQTLSIAMKENPNISFILSAGDQINKNVTGNDPGNEPEYAGFLDAA